jgi:hypothetical protein
MTTRLGQANFPDARAWFCDTAATLLLQRAMVEAFYIKKSERVSVRTYLAFYIGLFNIHRCPHH